MTVRDGWTPEQRERQDRMWEAKQRMKAHWLRSQEAEVSDGSEEGTAEPGA